MAETVIEILIKAKNATSKTLKDIDRSLRNIGTGRQIDPLRSKTKNLSNNLKDVAGSAEKAKKGLSAMSAIKLAAVALAVRQLVGDFLRFNKAIAEVSTLVDSAAISNKELSESVLELSDTYGVGATEVAKAYYQAVSAGAKAGEEANQLLAVALKTAIGGVTDAQTAVDGLTTVINAFGLKTSDAADVADSLFVAMKGGKTTIGELSSYLFQSATLASNLGVQYDDLLAAITALTKSGTPTAQSFTQVRAALVGLIRNTPELVKLFREQGDGSAAATIKNRGLAATLELVRKAAGGSEAQLVKLLGSQEAYLAVAGLTGDKLQVFNDALKEQEGRLGAADEAYKKINASISQKADKAVTRLINSFKRLTASFAPVIEGVLRITELFADFVNSIADVESVGGFFEDLAPGLEQVKIGFEVVFKAASEIVKAFGEVLGGAASLGGEFSLLNIVLGALGKALQLVALFLAAVADGVNVVVAGFATLVEWTAKVATGLAVIGGASDETVAALAGVAKGAEETADRIITKFKKGESAVQRVVKALRTPIKTGEVEPSDASKAKAQAEKDVKDLGKSTEDIALEIKKSLTDIATEVQATTSIALKDLDNKLKDNLISFKEYYSQRAALQQKALDAEIAAQRKAVEDATAAKDTTAAATAQSKLIVLIKKRAEISKQAARDQAEAERTLQEELFNVKVKLTELQTGGRIPLELDKERLELEYKDLIDRLKAEGDTAGLGIVRKLINTEASKNQFDQIQQQFNETVDTLQSYEDLRLQEAQAGVRDVIAVEEELNSKRLETIPILEQLIAETQRYVDKTGDPAAIVALDQMKTKLLEVKESANLVGKDIKDAFTNNATNALASFIDGTKSAKQAFRDFAVSMLKDVAQMISKLIILKIVRTAAGGFAGGGLVEAATGGYIKAASGGYITGPGTSTSDSIPARLSDGEYVLNAQAVKFYGLEFIEALNRKLAPKFDFNRKLNITRPRRAFASGGVVSQAAAAPEQKKEVSNPIMQTNLRIVNAVDPDLMEDYMRSATGEKTILNLIQRNATSIKRVLT